MKAMTFFIHRRRLTWIGAKDICKSYLAVGAMIAAGLPVATGVLGVELSPVALVIAVAAAALSIVTIIGAIVAPLIL